MYYKEKIHFMEYNFVLYPVIIFLLVIMFYFRFDNKIKNKTIMRLRYQYVCDILDLSSPVYNISYKKILDFWNHYKEEDSEIHVFINMVSNVLIKQIKDYQHFDQVLNLSRDFEETILTLELKENSKKTTKIYFKSKKIEKRLKSEVVLIKIHEAVVLGTIAKVSTLAQKQAHYLRVLPNGKLEEKEKKINLFKNNLKLKALKEYKLDYEALMNIEKEKITNSRKKEKLIELN